MIDVIGLHHIGLAVADLPAACDFYCSCGYTVGDRLHLTGPDPAIGNGLVATTLDIAFLVSPAVTLELLQFDPSGPALAPGDPCSGSVPVCAARAPTDPEGRPVIAVDDAQPLAIKLTTAVPDETAALFELLGFQAGSHSSLIGHGWSVGLETVAAAASTPGANRPGRMHVCFQTSDIERAIDELAAAGFPMVSTPRVSGNLRWVFVRHDGGPGVELLSITE